MACVDLRDKGIFEQHGLVGLPQPRGEASLEALLKQPADIAEICHPEHRLREIDLIPQPQQRALALL